MNNDKLIDYNHHKFNLLEKMMYASVGSMIVFLISLIFYGSLSLSIVLLPLGLFYIPYKKKIFINKRRNTLKQQFKEGLYAISSSLSAGKSIEAAFNDALKDLNLVYQNQESYIIQEFNYIVRQISMNETIEVALINFSNRTMDEDITNFVNVFVTAKRTGGNLIEIMEYTSQVINEKIEIKNNIDVIITEKKFEQKIMALMLPLIIIYLYLFSGFLGVMYETIVGRLAMTIALVLYIISFILGQKIVNIEV